MKRKLTAVITTFLLVVSFFTLGVKPAEAITCTTYSSIVPSATAPVWDTGTNGFKTTVTWYTPGFWSTSALTIYRLVGGQPDPKYFSGPNGTPSNNCKHVVTATGLQANTIYYYYGNSVYHDTCKRSITRSLPKTGAAPPTCSDGIQNQGETGIDCGGPCKACSGTPPPPDNPPPTPEPEPESEPGSGPIIEESTATEDIVAPVEDKQAPAEPTNLKAEYNQEKNEINLSWDSSSDDNLAGYEIERTEKSKEQWKKVGESDTESYTDFEFAPNTAYEYRVKAFDVAKNYSLYSNVAETLSGEFIPNVTVKDGGTVQSEDGLAIAQFPSQSVDEDIFVSIEKSNEQEFELEKDDTIVGNIYSIQAKTHRGEEPQNFKTQIPIILKFTSKDTRNINSGTLRIGRFNEENIEYPNTIVDLNAGEAKTLTDHFSQYFLVAKKGNAFTTFLRILMWILIIAGLGTGGYFSWQWWQRKQYQEEHREDYIYKH